MVARDALHRHVDELNEQEFQGLIELVALNRLEYDERPR